MLHIILLFSKGRKVFSFEKSSGARKKNEKREALFTVLPVC